VNVYGTIQKRKMMKAQFKPNFSLKFFFFVLFCFVFFLMAKKRALNKIEGLSCNCITCH
jgi:hypothetical protein